MALKAYIKKRDFKKTPEPKGKSKKNLKSLEFVVQRHDATRLHYDFRLEMEGVLKSWAVPKGPSLNPDDKRLAVMVEDHPFDYRTFEGVIPRGNYGAGTVEIWDKGTYNAMYPSKDTEEKELLRELAKGDLKFILHGKKLKGAFALVRLKNAEKGNNWLLIKKKDKYAVDSYDSEDYLSMTVQKGKRFQKEEPPKKASPNKVITGQPKGAASAPKKKLTRYIKPMLAKETDKAFDDDDWVFEIKWDGYRAIAETGKDLKLYSRNGLIYNDRYPEVVEELEKIKSWLVLDGEIAALDENGHPNFQKLQNFDPSESSLVYYLFDILQKKGKDLTSLPLLERKAILKETVKTNGVIRYSDHIVGEGIRFFEIARQRNIEGLIAKKADSIYLPGVRTGDWLKIKNVKNQEAVIVGFTEPRNSRKFFGSLVLGVYEGSKLKYAGHTGTGFNDKTLRELYEKLLPLKQEHSPFKERIKTNMPVTWVQPKLVSNVKFSEITNDGIMRHPVFMGLRVDKEAREVVNEKKRMVMKPSSKKTNPPEKKPGRKNPGKIKDVVDIRPKKISANEDGVKIGKHLVKITNPDKIYFPEKKITKGDVIAYYQSVAKYILPYLKERPQSLLRNPNGIRDKGFFHKDVGESAPSWVKSKKIYSESAKKDIDYLVCNDQETLAYMNNLGCIELNPWHSRLSKLDNPDYLAIDLDPSPENTFDEVIETALAVKEVFDRAGADCYCKTSGASGLHIYVPLGAKYDYDHVKDFANIVAIMVSEMLPDFTSVIRPLKQRGNKIYVDFLQNRRGQTLACAYSLRPREEATISTPLQWKEVKKGLHPTQFNIDNISKRLGKTGDLFSGVLGKGIDLKKCLDNLG